MPIKHNSGFSLIEVMVTVAITTVGLVGLSAMQLEANRSTFDSGNRSQAIWMIEDLTNRIKANQRNLAINYDTGGSPVNCSSTPVINCASYYDGSNQISPGACSSVDLIQYDLWDVACSRSTPITGSDIVRTSAVDFIANPQLEVSATQDLVTITLTWDVRSSGTDAENNTVYISDSNLTSNKISTLQATISSDFIP